MLFNETLPKIEVFDLKPPATYIEPSVAMVIAAPQSSSGPPAVESHAQSPSDHFPTKMSVVLPVSCWFASSDSSPACRSNL